MAETLTRQTIEAAKLGDHSAFELIYREHSRRIYYLCLKIVKSEADAEEMGQEVFLHLFRFIRTYRGDCKFSSWLHRVCVTVVYCKLRKKRLTTVSLTSSEENDASNVSFEIGSSDRTLCGTPDRLAIEGAIAKLPERARTVFELHDRFGYQHKEIAMKMGISSGTAKSQLVRARNQLRKYLAA
jgi:RNA polymerase sigma-70 factor (ECF subfamily)